VYETETTFGENLKTNSSTSLLFQKRTTDNVFKVLGCCNNFENEEKAVIAMITEVDPDKQPKATEED
jgi:hypothetical protein